VNAGFEVVHGDPSDEELAVVISLLSAAASVPVQSVRPTRSNWGRPAMRITGVPGPGSWNRAGLPQP
jgi:hypothetical protein